MTYKDSFTWSQQ